MMGTFEEREETVLDLLGPTDRTKIPYGLEIIPFDSISCR